MPARQVGMILGTDKWAECCIMEGKIRVRCMVCKVVYFVVGSIYPCYDCLTGSNT